MSEPIVEQERRLGEIGDRRMGDAVLDAMGSQAAFGEDVIGARRRAKIGASIAHHDAWAAQIR